MIDEFYENISVIKFNENIFKKEILIDRNFDILARENHKKYTEESGVTDSDWNKLGTFKQNSNRAMALDVANKELLIDKNWISDNCDNKKMIYQIVKKLAVYEHRRWNSFHRSRGWRYKAVDKNESTSVIKWETEKCHACLINNWFDLDKLPQDKSGLLRYYDVRIVIMSLEIIKDILCKDVKIDDVSMEIVHKK